MENSFPIQIGDSFYTDEKKYSAFRYNFEPDSVDKFRGSVSVEQDDSVSVEFLHQSNPDESHVYKGNRQPCKEVDCVLIFDPSNNSYRLEKLGYVYHLRNIRKSATLKASNINARPKIVATTEENPINHESSLDESDFEALAKSIINELKN